MQVHAMASPRPGAPLEPLRYDAEPGRGQVLVRVSHCGICHSDVHLVDGDWGTEQHPLVPGHEVVGVVEEVGPGVHGHEPGDRVGVGWQCGACHACDRCAAGQQNLCPQGRATARHRGGFATHVIVDDRLAFPIPDGLDSARTAPLLCGGVTTYAPIKRFARPGDRVGIVGLGGLGHLGVLWAKAMGCGVTVFSHSPDKQGDAERLGADAFVSSTDSDAVRAARCDLIVQTTFSDLDWGAYLRALRPDGTLCFVGAPPGPLGLRAGDLLSGQKRVAGSAIGGAADIREMLRLAALHDVGAVVERVPLSEADAALERTRRGGARYRMVLEA